MWCGGRSVGREGIDPPVSADGWSTASCAPWRDRPTSKPVGIGLDDDVSAVVEVLIAELDARRVSGLGRCRTPGRRCWRPRRHHWLEPKDVGARGRARDAENALTSRRGASELPAHDGPAGMGKLPSSRLVLMIGVLAGCARERAEARQGSTLERSFGDADACHGNDNCELRDRDMSTGFTDARTTFWVVGTVSDLETVATYLGSAAPARG